MSAELAPDQCGFCGRHGKLPECCDGARNAERIKRELFGSKRTHCEHGTDGAFGPCTVCGWRGRL